MICLLCGTGCHSLWSPFLGLNPGCETEQLLDCLENHPARQQVLRQGRRPRPQAGPEVPAARHHQTRRFCEAPTARTSRARNLADGVSPRTMRQSGDGDGMPKVAGVLPNGRRRMNEHGPADGPNGVQVREIIGRSGCLHRMRSGADCALRRLSFCCCRSLPHSWKQQPSQRLN